MKTIKPLKGRALVLARVAGLLAVALLVLVIIGHLGNARARKTYPLVLIHSPMNHEQIAVGDVGNVHASARSPSGVRRIEFWADGVLMDALERPEEETHSILVLNAGWEPRTLGRHVLVVRAVSVKGVESQATVFVEAVEGQGALKSHMIGEGETLEQIAADHGLDTGELVDMNPGLDPDDLEAGDFVNVPGGAPHTGRDEDAGADLPSADEPSPNSSSEPVDATLLGFGLPFNPSGASGSPSDEPVLLRLEALALETAAAYESLHCYASVGDRPPRWYPDTDGDQASSEYFSSDDGTSWNVEAYMAGQTSPVVYWPGDQVLPFTITCVGIQGGGTEAIELGPMSLSIPPAMWDGVLRTARTELGEGSFSLDYRVTQEELIPKFPDRDLARPTNLWINYNGGYLAWDYWPQEDQEPIDGFMVFLNDTLIWEESADARRSWLPDPWLIPPCGDEYEFTVEAFVRPYPIGSHSVSREPWEEDYAGDRATITGAEPGSADCARRYVINFHSLTTGEIPEDAVDWPAVNWDHGAGPIHGNLYTNDHNRFFEFWRFVPNVEYSVEQLLAGSGQSGSITITRREGDEEDIWFGFQIRDEDEGGYPVLCHGSEIMSVSLFDALGFYEGEIASQEDDGHRCRVAYTIHLADGSSVGTGGDALPLPQLNIEDFSVEPTSGQLRVHVRNIGLVPWAHHDLEVRVSTHSGDFVGDITWEDFYLEVGETVMLDSPRLTPHPPFDVCVTLDPEDKVLELFEYTDSIHRNHACAPVPDLSISDVQYDPAREALMVTVQNRGELRATGPGILDDRNLHLQIAFDDGSFLETAILDVSMGRVDETQLTFPGIGEGLRSRMLAGYSVIVDPNNAIAELDDDNNEYRVPAGAVITVSWLEAHLYALPIRSYDTCYDWSSQEQTVSVRVFVESDYESRRVADWSITQDMSIWEYLFEFDWDEHLVEFRIRGDQILTIEVSGEVNSDDMGSARVSYGPEENWMAPTSGVYYPVYAPEFEDCRGPWNVYLSITSSRP